MMSVAIALHVLSAVVWVGGMFFAYTALRPVAASLLEPPERLPLWYRVFARFFPWVWIAIVLLPLTGYWLILAEYGGMGAVGIHVHVMNGLGLVMIFLYLYVFFGPYRALGRAVAAQDWPDGGKQLGRIRHIIGVNLSLGIIVVAVAAYGGVHSA
jgi:uncharacterized membrane protein